jgi:carotenoid cleavage dioxygenase-like enzyme
MSRRRTAEGWIAGEVTFVPAQGATAEDDGWLVAICLSVRT